MITNGDSLLRERGRNMPRRIRHHLEFAAVIALAVWTIVGAQAFAVLSDAPRGDMWETNGGVRALARTTDTLYIGGEFTYVGPHTGGGVPVDAGTGQAVPSFPLVDGSVSACAPDGSGGWYVAGNNFTNVGGVSRRSLVHILANGTVDPVFQADVTMGGVATMVVRGSTIYLGGYFDTVKGQGRRRLAALDAVTGDPTPWNPTVSVGSAVFTLAVSPDGNTVYVGGEFSEIAGEARRNLVALDASTGALTSWNPQVNAPVRALVLTDSTIYIAGHFGAVNGQPRSRIAALSLADAALADWDPSPLAAATGSIIYALAISGSTIYVGGDFDAIGGQPRSYIAALDAVTGDATSWNANANSTVTSLAVVAGFAVYAGGAFTNIGGEERYHVAALDISTGEATAWNPCANGSVNALAVAGSTVYAGGTFWSIGGEPRRNLAAFDPATGESTDWRPDPDAKVASLAVSSDKSKVFVAGDFTSIAGQSHDYIAAFSADTGNVLSWNPSSSASISDIVVSGNRLYVAGGFDSIGGQPRRYLAALNVNNAKAIAWDPYPDHEVWAIAVPPSGNRVYVSGGFDQIGGLARTHLAALNADTGNATMWEPTVTAGYIFTLAVSGSTVYAGGSAAFGERQQPRLAALDSTTAGVTAWSPATDNEVYVLGVSGDGKAVYAGGAFDTDGRGHLGAFDAVTGDRTSWNPNVRSSPSPEPEEGYVRALLVFGSTLYVGGDFAKIGGLSRIGVAQFDALPRVTRAEGWQSYR
jgi:trimeric autotransporter adhesin